MLSMNVDNSPHFKFNKTNCKIDVKSFYSFFHFFEILFDLTLTEYINGTCQLITNITPTSY